MLGYLSADIICSERRTVFQERSSRKTVSYKEQMMSKDKYPSIFSPQMEAIVFIILQIFYETRAVLKIGEYPRIPRDAFRPIACERKYLMDYECRYTVPNKYGKPTSSGGCFILFFLYFGLNLSRDTIVVIGEMTLSTLIVHH